MAQTTENRTSELDRIWTQWLCREYDAANWYYRLKLTRPLIRIDYSKSRLGSWDPLTRVITINGRAIVKYPWNEVVHILKHEMAHQIVSERTNSRERVHGQAFQAACRRLGLPDWAAKASGDLPGEVPNWRDTSLTENEQRLITKVQKLLALAASENEHEASLAMQRVREMYAKYNLEQIQEQVQAGMVTWVVSLRKRRTEAWETVILSLLSRHFFVRVIHIKQFDAQDCVEYAAAEVMGKRENVLMAEYVFRFLSQTLVALWQKQQPSFAVRNKGAALRREKRNYYLGVLKGFERQLDVSQEQSLGSLGISHVETTALVKAIDLELERFVETKYPRTSKKSGSRFDTQSDAYQSGKNDGSKIRLHRPLEHHEGNRGLLLK